MTSLLFNLLHKGFIDEVAGSLDEAIAKAKEYAAAGKPLGIAVVGNAADIFEEVLEKGWLPDISTSMTPGHDPISYLPAGYTVEEAEELRDSNRELYLEKARETMVRELKALINI